jgi:hypothetical protein
MRVFHCGRIEWRFDKSFELEARVDALSHERTQSASMNHYRHSFPRRVFARAHGTTCSSVNIAELSCFRVAAAKNTTGAPVAERARRVECRIR